MKTSFFLAFYFSRFINSFLYYNIKNSNTYLKSKKTNNNYIQNTNDLLYKPKGVNQELYFETLNDKENKLLLIVGPAGTGKTLFACQKAITDLKKMEINKIIITRPVITVDEEIGFLPGNIIKKMDPWTKPIFDIFLEYYNKLQIDQMINNGKIEICPLAFMRGRTFKNAFIIADEMQNSSPNQMKMLTTRIGDNSRIVITGDLQQSDIPINNGLNDLTTKITNYKKQNENPNKLFKIIELTHNDIERSEIVKIVLDIYNTNATLPISKIQIPISNTAIPLKNTTLSIINDAALIPKSQFGKNTDIFYM